MIINGPIKIVAHEHNPYPGKPVGLEKWEAFASRITTPLKRLNLEQVTLFKLGRELIEQTQEIEKTSGHGEYGAFLSYRVTRDSNTLVVTRNGNPVSIISGEKSRQPFSSVEYRGTLDGKDLSRGNAKDFFHLLERANNRMVPETIERQ